MFGFGAGGRWRGFRWMNGSAECEGVTGVERRNGRYGVVAGGERFAWQDGKWVGWSVCE